MKLQEMDIKLIDKITASEGSADVFYDRAIKLGWGVAIRDMSKYPLERWKPFFYNLQAKTKVDYQAAFKSLLIYTKNSIAGRYEGADQSQNLGNFYLSKGVGPGNPPVVQDTPITIKRKELFGKDSEFSLKESFSGYLQNLV